MTSRFCWNFIRNDFLNRIYRGKQYHGKTTSTAFAIRIHSLSKTTQNSFEIIPPWVRNWASFISNIRNQKRPHPRRFEVCLFNKTLIEPLGSRSTSKPPEISSQPSWRLQTFIIHFCNHRKSSLASWPSLNDIWRSSFLLEKKAPLFLTDTFL